MEIACGEILLYLRERYDKSLLTKNDPERFTIFPSKCALKTLMRTICVREFPIFLYGQKNNSTTNTINYGELRVNIFDDFCESKIIDSIHKTK